MATSTPGCECGEAIDVTRRYITQQRCITKATAPTSNEARRHSINDNSYFPSADNEEFIAS